MQVPYLQEAQELTILIVDDDADMRNYLSICVNQIPGCTVLEAFNVPSAVTFARIASPDLVISDCGVPRMNGLAICDAFKQDLSLSHIPIFLIGNVGANDHPDAHEFVLKPFNATIIRNLVTQLGVGLSA